MGQDKARIVFEGQTLAIRGATLLKRVCSPVVEVGPGVSGLPAVREKPAGSGPLPAVAAGGRALRTAGRTGPAIVLAVDMPRVPESLLRFLAEQDAAAVVPVANGEAQPLCAVYSRAALELAEELASRGEHSMYALLDGLEVMWIQPEQWLDVAAPDALTDLDTPEDLARLAPVS
jgi:molybdopterin-guanine dinucleotide biosynthesis protein A